MPVCKNCKHPLWAHHAVTGKCEAIRVGATVQHKDGSLSFINVRDCDCTNPKSGT